MYWLEVHTSLILGHIIRCPELEIAVKYPNDYTISFGTEQDYEWLTGWNFVIDLYRGPEHILVHFRSKRRGVDCSEQKTIFTTGLGDPGKEERLQLLKTRYDGLPDHFK